MSELMKKASKEPSDKGIEGKLEMFFLQNMKLASMRPN